MNTLSARPTERDHGINVRPNWLCGTLRDIDKSSRSNLATVRSTMRVARHGSDNVLQFVRGRFIRCCNATKSAVHSGVPQEKGMDSDDIAASNGARRSAAFRALHRKLDPIDGPRNLGAKRLALRDQRHRQDVADWHVGLLKTGGQGTCVLISCSGTVAFAIAQTPTGLFIEKRCCPPTGPRTSHAMRFEDRSTFDQWCDIEPTRFDDPLLCDLLRRRGHEIFAGHG